MPTALAPATASVGITSISISAENVNRKGGLFINTDPTATISLGFGYPAVLGAGVTLMPGGGSYSMDFNNISTAQINAIASAVGTNLAFQEYN